MPVKQLKEHLDRQGVKYVTLSHSRAFTAQDVAGAKQVALAGEKDFNGLFPECELGAMPPFGSLYGLPTFASDRLARQGQIAFSAGTHTEVIRLSYADFVRLAGPTIAAITID